MGCGQSTDDVGDAKSLEASRRIDEQLRAEHKKQTNEVKLLLLGTGESGKSTFVKQMKIIHQNGYATEERKNFKEVIYSNVLNSMKIIIAAAESLNIEIGSDNTEAANKIADVPTDAVLLMEWPRLAPSVKALWMDDGIQDTFLRANEFQLNDSASYYFDAIERISADNYLPTVQDILRSRVRSTGIVEVNFTYKDVLFRMFDVGGQRNERKKWIHCFQGVTAVLFVTSLSEYDQRLFEDETQNRMVESLSLFDEICNSRWFKDTGMILFLNKTDLFKEKLSKASLSIVFPDYEGGDSFESACEFVTKKFLELNRDPDKNVFAHLTCATDTDSVKMVFADVKESIIQVGRPMRL